MIVMSYMSVVTSRYDSVELEYKSARPGEYGPLPPVVYLNLRDGGGNAYVALTIEDARAVAEALPQIIMLHDAAERLAAEKAVA
ncbi:hypothetical protein [Nocardia nepalensis]|uniref:hypothetical protein n=1 Tax=Nocardia nepalensis TaxID=3375448 RepID=UPI003B66FAD3